MKKTRVAFRKWLPNSKFALNVLILTGGTAVAQGLAALAWPLLTRFYTPQDFGILAVFSSILSILLVVIS